jgi:WD40 repeat protein
MDGGHIGGVRAVVFSPDGTMLASLGTDRLVKLWNATTGDVIHTLHGHSGNVRGVAFTSEGSKIASASNDKTIRLWKVITGKELQTLTGHTRPVNCVAFSDDGEKIASASNDTSVRIWTAATGESIQVLRGHTDWVTSVAFSHKLIAAGASDKTICLWNTETGLLIKRFEIHQIINTLTFSDNDQHIRAGDRWFDAITGRPSKEALPEKPAPRTRLNEDWIERDEKKALWLPPDYRPTCSATRGDLHALGHASGRVTFLEFEWPEDW